MAPSGWSINNVTITNQNFLNPTCSVIKFDLHNQQNSNPTPRTPFWASRPMKSETNCSYQQGMAFIFNFTNATIDWSIFWSHSTPMSWIVWWRSGSNPGKKKSKCAMSLQWNPKNPSWLWGYDPISNTNTTADVDGTNLLGKHANKTVQYAAKETNKYS